MSVLTSILTVCALCVVQSHAAFEYIFDSPSPSPHEASYTVIQVPIPAHGPSGLVRTFNFFGHSPSPSVSVTPNTLLQTPEVISPYSQPPTKTPAPLRLIHKVLGGADVATVPTSSISASPSGELQSFPVVTTPSVPSDDAHASVPPAPSPSRPLSPPSPPLTKRIIAIPLRVPRPLPPSDSSPSPSMSAHQFETKPYQVQRHVFVPQRETHSYFKPSPAFKVQKVEDMPPDVQHDVLTPPTFQIPPLSVSPQPSLLVSIAPSSSIPPNSIPPEVDAVDHVFAMEATIPPNGQIVTPFPLPSASQTIVPLEIRLQKRIHATPLPMPSMSPLPSHEPRGPHADLMRNVESGFLLGNTFENNAKPTPQNPCTVTPSAVPSVGPSNAVRVARRHRVPSIRTGANAASDTLPSPGSTPSEAPSKLETHGTKMFHRHRRPVRVIYRHRLPSLKVKMEPARSTVASPSPSPSTKPAKLWMHDVKMLNRHRIPIRDIYRYRLPSLKVEKEPTRSTFASPSPSPSTKPAKLWMHEVKMLNRHRVPVRNLYRHRMPSLKVRKETVFPTTASPSSAPEYSEPEPDADGFGPSPAPSKALLVYGERMVRAHGVSFAEAKKQNLGTAERVQGAAFGGFGGSSSPSPQKAIGPTPSVSRDVDTAYSTPMVVKSSVPPSPSPSYVPGVSEESVRVAMELNQNFNELGIMLASPEEEDYSYCESVKQCMCAVIDDKLLSTSLLSYCDHLNELNYSFCEQSKEAHIFLQFWTHKQGTSIKSRGMELVNECNLGDIMIHYDRLASINREAFHEPL
ncbi:hypothetical protein FGB62_9g312 [Gracilaria domingensis]|nr:hypothetical protein FGB62_9g312 [Gracilaria domingensis]